MSTTTNASFDAMLRSYAPDALFKEELVKRDWFLSNVDSDDNWLGDNLEIRFKAAGANSVRYGSLTDATDISQSSYVRGIISNQPEVWGSIIFNHKDLMRHGKISEQNFLKLLPGEVDDFTQFMKMGISLGFTNGPTLATVTDATNAATGQFVVNRIERFDLNQKLQLIDNDTAAVAVYVTNIVIDSNTVTVSATRGGAAFNAAAYSVAQNARFVMDGQETTANQLSSLKLSLLSAANGGTSNLYGQSKLSAPYLQAINIAGSTITTTNILDQLFSAQTQVRNKGRGMADTIICSYKHLGAILQRLETLKGAYRQANDMKASLYGWTEVEIVGVKGMLKIVAIQELDDDYMVILDKSALKIYSNGGVTKRVNPDGREYYEIRNSGPGGGYQYIVDIAFMGDMVLERPSRCGIVYGINTSTW